MKKIIFILLFSLMIGLILPQTIYANNFPNLALNLKVQYPAPDLKVQFDDSFSAEPFVAIPEIAGVFAFLTLMGMLLIPIIIILIALYVYVSLAYMALAKKTGTSPAWLAWIPVLNLYLLSQMAKMHWWPVLLILATWIPFINIIASVTLGVFGIIWSWKIFERVQKPGWWALTMFIPIAGGIVFYVLLGIAAWSKNSKGTVPSK